MVHAAFSRGELRKDSVGWGSDWGEGWPLSRRRAERRCWGWSYYWVTGDHWAGVGCPNFASKKVSLQSKTKRNANGFAWFRFLFAKLWKKNFASFRFVSLQKFRFGNCFASNSKKVWFYFFSNFFFSQAITKKSANLQGCRSHPEPPFLAGAGAVFLVRLRLLLLLLLTGL